VRDKAQQIQDLSHGDHRDAREPQERVRQSPANPRPEPWRREIGLLEIGRLAWPNTPRTAC
jgi:hypothetical protein